MDTQTGVLRPSLALKPDIGSMRVLLVLDSENRDKIAMIKHSPVRGMCLLPESLSVRCKGI
jgi:hypothetical protein